MKDKLHCPFCSEEIAVANEMVCVCQNDKCPAWGRAYPKFVLTALIDGKKAQEALNDIVDDIDRALYANHYNDKIGVRKILKDLRTSITKQEK